MSKFFIADPVHINKKNFGSLYEFLDESKATTIFNTERQDWISLFGDYSAHQEFLLEEYNHLNTLTRSELFNLSVLEINIFKVSRSETLSLLITKEAYSNTPLPTTRRELFDYIFETDKDILLWNMASAIQWINHWSLVIKKHNPKFVLVFSGSLIYARSLLEILKNNAPRAFVLESFFTGTDNYIEEKYEPIANNSNLKLKAYFRSLGNDESPHERDRSRNKAINKILNSTNKNVTQPAENPAKLFNNSQPTILITGQVLNDFSLLEYKDTGLNSLSFYKNIIELILNDTDFNIIFKAHPWERKKKNITSALTLDTLAAHFKVNEKNYSRNGRLLLLEDYNIKSIFKQTELVIGLNSQALLEAAFEGFQPVQFANAFYGNRGFTSDYCQENLDTFITDLKSGKIPSKLGINQYKAYEEFITKALQFSLVSAFPSGKTMLRSIFSVTPHIALTPKQVQTEKSVENKTASTKQTPTPQTTTSQNQTKPVKPAENKTAITKLVAGPTTKAIAQEAKTSPSDSAAQKVSRKNKKLAKLLTTPKKFFLDSKNKRIRWLHHFFWSRK